MNSRASVYMTECAFSHPPGQDLCSDSDELSGELDGSTGLVFANRWIERASPPNEWTDDTANASGVPGARACLFSELAPRSLCSD